MAEKQPAHVEQALAELASAGEDVERARAARKRLAAAGVEPEQESTDPPKARRSRHDARSTTA